MIHANQGIGMTSQRTRARMIDRLRSEGIQNESVLNVMAVIPRHIFIDEALASRAYDNVALPLGFGQTISQPYIVARMTELLFTAHRLGNILEIGTGCGYQTAILAQLAQEVHSIERIAPLLDKARIHLKSLRLNNVRLYHADGVAGLPKVAPFDGILMAAATTEIPQFLLEQLAVGGKIVFPLGAKQQHLWVIERTAVGFTQTQLEPVKFVPLIKGLA